MKAIPFLLLVLITCAGSVRAQSDSEPVDFIKARQLIERQKSGDTLTVDEKAYIERAKAERRARQGGTTAPDGIDWAKARELLRRQQSGEALTAEEQAYLNKARETRRGGTGNGGISGGNQRKAPDSLTPLCDMGAQDRYEGEDGGLYGGGMNTAPESLKRSAAVALEQIRPIDGKIVFISISMSNATMEFSTFKRIADADERKSEEVSIIDCAQGGQAMAEWAIPGGRPWQEALQRISRAGAAPEQVQVAWIKLANKMPSGSMADHLTKLESDTTKVLQIAKSIFPNLRIAYLGSRIWAGNATTRTNPEPYAYEGAFAVRHLIHQQMKGATALDQSKAPLLLWGPYLWAEGMKGREIDDLKWEPQDFNSDGTHPSQSGREKVAKLLLDFFCTDPLAKGWFAK